LLLFNAPFPRFANKSSRLASRRFGLRRLYLDDVEMAPGVTYTMIGVGEGTGGGMMKTPAPGVPTAWLPYVLVDDVAAATAKAKSLGATVCKDITEVMGEGFFSVIADPTGATIGLWQPKAK
jgi:predicted enzyme related to lactoylglutathione lyase